MRVTYAVTLLVVTIIITINSYKEKIDIATVVSSVQHALNLIDPFYIVRHLYMFNPFHQVPLHIDYSDPEYRLVRGDEPETIEELIKQAGWLTGSFIAGCTTIMFFLLDLLRPKREGNLVWAFLLSFIVAFPLKWLLIGLVVAFGSVVGFIGRINGVVIGVIEGFLQAHHIYKGGLEVKGAAQEMHHISKPPPSV
jgi:hypothetical protein